MKFVKAIFLLLFSLTFTGCSSDNEDEIVDEKEDTRYYVKYESYMYLSNSRYDSNTITCITDKGTESFVISKAEWEGTFGPLKKGTQLYIEVKSSSINTNVENYVRLSVCREKEPFVIKGEERKRGTSVLSTEYTIDF
ncbi:MAG: hypothetical protein J6K19_10645 [Prevotella sp.]|nr:hypothetical protein [Prevotella sp.]